MITMELKKTPFYQKHLEHKAKIVDYAGYALALEYKSILGEAKAARNTCGLFDASHMGQLVISGNKSFDFIQQAVTNDISQLVPGQMQYNLFLNDKAKVLDDCMVYCRKDDFFCVVNAANKEKVYNWLKQKKISGVDIRDESDGTALLSLQGPVSSFLIDDVVERKVSDLKYLSFEEFSFSGHKIVISRSGYTGEDGFEIYLPWAKALIFWDKILEAGRDRGLTLCGLGARDILRIEAGYPLYGHELSEDIDPYTAGLGWAVKLNKEFNGKKELSGLKEKASLQKRIGFVLKERGLPRQGYGVFFNGSCIGRVSSGIFSPNLEQFIGMAFVDRNILGSAKDIQIGIRDKLYKAEVVRFPFIQPRVKPSK
ncbi:MAG: glycine cleavage system aminomethyltransferase GcvT [Candidatus Omnitrophica bacterium]|nr:glycine cleavage system aminomethyltransferase GcvT [Candidatus Omnitrophota bacterium]